MNPFEEIGAYSPELPVARDVPFNGKTARMWFVQHSYAGFIDQVANPEVKDGQRRELVVLGNIVRFDEEGKTRPTYDQLAKLDREFVEVLIKVAYGVNGVDLDAPKGAADEAKN
jgi:hypothetical protein